MKFSRLFSLLLAGLIATQPVLAAERHTSSWRDWAQSALNWTRSTFTVDNVKSTFNNLWERAKQNPKATALIGGAGLLTAACSIGIVKTVFGMKKMCEDVEWKTSQEDQGKTLLPPDDVINRNASFTFLGHYNDDNNNIPFIRAVKNFISNPDNIMDEEIVQQFKASLDTNDNFTKYLQDEILPNISHIEDLNEQQKTYILNLSRNKIVRSIEDKIKEAIAVMPRPTTISDIVSHVSDVPLNPHKEEPLLEEEEPQPLAPAAPQVSTTFASASGAAVPPAQEKFMKLTNLQKTCINQAVARAFVQELNAENNNDILIQNLKKFLTNPAVFINTQQLEDFVENQIADQTWRDYFDNKIWTKIPTQLKQATIPQCQEIQNLQNYRNDNDIFNAAKKVMQKHFKDVHYTKAFAEHIIKQYPPKEIFNDEVVDWQRGLYAKDNAWINDPRIMRIPISEFLEKNYNNQPPYRLSQATETYIAHLSDVDREGIRNKMSQGLASRAVEYVTPAIQQAAGATSNFLGKGLGIVKGFLSRPSTPQPQAAAVTVPDLSASQFIDLGKAPETAAKTATKRIAANELKEIAKSLFSEYYENSELSRRIEEILKDNKLTTGIKKHKVGELINNPDPAGIFNRFFADDSFDKYLKTQTKFNSETIAQLEVQSSEIMSFLRGLIDDYVAFRLTSPTRRVTKEPQKIE